MDDWVEMLLPFHQRDIDRACSTYLRDQPRRRPTPGDIRARASGASTPNAKGNRENLSYDELKLLHDKIIPTARRWLDIPALAEQGRKTLEHWGEIEPRINERTTGGR